MINHATQLMDVAEIARRTGSTPRLLRYVLFHGLVPGTDRASRGRGSTRSFPVTKAFAIALAARLLQAGLRQPFVKGLVRGLVDDAAGLEGPLARPPAPDAAMVFEVADGANVRMRRGRGGALDEPRWAALATGRPVELPYRPGVVVRVDLADVLRSLRADDDGKGEGPPDEG